MNNPKVAVVVCVYNGVDYIEKCMNSLLDQNHESYEIIVVDDGSRDGTTKVLAKFGGNEKVRVFKSPENLGLMKSRNIGVSKTEAEFVAFTDADCVVEKNWLSELIKPFAIDKAIAIVGGKIMDGALDKYWGQVAKGVYKIADKSDYVSSIIGCNMAFRTAFLITYRFDETLKYGADEADLCAEAEDANLKIYYTNEAKVTHFHRSKFIDFVEQWYLLGIGNCYFRIKHKIIPPVTIKSIILLLIPVSLVLIAIKVMLYTFLTLFFGFIVIVFYEDLRAGEKSLKELICSLPGRIVMASAESAGFIAGLFVVFDLYLKKRLS